MSQLRDAKAAVLRDREKLYREKFDAAFCKFDQIRPRAILRAKNEKTSAWLIVPLAKNHFNLLAQEFWDALSIKYKKPLRCIPDQCDGYGGQFCLSHALSRRKRGLVIQQHNEVRDAIGGLAIKDLSFLTVLVRSSQSSAFLKSLSKQRKI